MEYDSRVRSLLQQSRELDTEFLSLQHRIKRVGERQSELLLLRTQVNEAKEDLRKVTLAVELVKQKLPVLARNEEVEQFTKRLNAMPFEMFEKSTSKISESNFESEKQ